MSTTTERVSKVSVTVGNSGLSGVVVPAADSAWNGWFSTATPSLNRVIAGDDEALRSSSFEIAGVNWVSVAEPAEPVRAEVKIRHKHEAAPATIQPLPEGRARVSFDEPQRAITPGQGAVGYAGDVVLFGGWIQ